MDKNLTHLHKITPLLRITAAKNIAATMSKSQNKVYLSSDSLFLNIRDTDRDASLFSAGLVDAPLESVAEVAEVAEAAAEVA